MRRKSRRWFDNEDPLSLLGTAFWMMVGFDERCVVDSLKVEGDNDDGLGTLGIQSIKFWVAKACLCIR
jgi:hypothetical protein